MQTTGSRAGDERRDLQGHDLGVLGRESLSGRPREHGVVVDSRYDAPDRCRRSGEYERREAGAELQDVPRTKSVNERPQELEDVGSQFPAVLSKRPADPREVYRGGLANGPLESLRGPLDATGAR